MRIAGALVVMLLLSSGRAAAEPDDLGVDLGLDEPSPADDATADEAAPIRDPRAARQLADGAAKFVKKGDRLAKKKKLAEANAEFERAIAAYDKSFEFHPDARVLVAAAVLVARLGRALDAALRYRRALAETELPLDAATRSRAEAAVEELMLALGVVTLLVEPADATVVLDDQEIAIADPLWLAPGQYALAIHADGYQSVEARLVVEAGGESERRFELQPVPVPVVVERPRPPPPPPPPALPPPPSRTGLYVGVGTTGLFAIGAVIAGVLAIGEHGTFTDPEASIEERDAARASGRTMALLTDAMLTGAVLAAGFTAYYYSTIYKPKAREYEQIERQRGEAHDELAVRRRARPKWMVAPVVQRDGGGLVLAGWF
jgi:hypothetical protein